MGIRIIHGNGDLIGDALRGVSEGVQAYQKGSLANREMADREAQTKAYTQRIADARLLKQTETDMAREEADREALRQKALYDVTVGMAGQQVAGLAQSEDWTKDDEAEFRVLDKQLQAAGVTGKDYETAMDSALEQKALALAERRLQNEKAQLADTIMRYATPGTSGVPLLDEETAQLYLQQVETGSGLDSLRKSLIETVRAKQQIMSLERDMAEVGALAEQAQGAPGLTSSQRTRIATINLNMIANEKGYSPEESRLRIQAIMSGDGDTLDAIIGERDKLREQAQANAQNMGLGQRGAAPQPEVQKALEAFDAFVEGADRTPEEMTAWAEENGIDLEAVLIAAERRVSQKLTASVNAEEEDLPPEMFGGGYQEASGTLPLNPSAGAGKLLKSMRGLK